MNWVSVGSGPEGVFVINDLGQLWQYFPEYEGTSGTWPARWERVENPPELCPPDDE